MLKKRRLDQMNDDEKRLLEKQFSGEIKDIKHMINLIGDEPEREGLKDTPLRVIKSWGELYSGYKQNPQDILSTVFEEKMEAHDEIVMCKNITFSSMCEHHMLPFHGVVHIGYLPNKKVVGLSKLARLVECFSKRLQIQEHLTDQIVDSIMTYLEPQGAGVIISAKHLCMSHRGVKNATSEMVTSAMRGKFKDQFQTRQEFLTLIKM
jgi:GTP cyclohydrolase I